MRKKVDFFVILKMCGQIKVLNHPVCMFRYENCMVEEVTAPPQMKEPEIWLGGRLPAIRGRIEPGRVLSRRSPAICRPKMSAVITAKFLIRKFYPVSFNRESLREAKRRYWWKYPGEEWT